MLTSLTVQEVSVRLRGHVYTKNKTAGHMFVNAHCTKQRRGGVGGDYLDLKKRQTRKHTIERILSKRNLWCRKNKTGVSPNSTWKHLIT